MTFEKIKYAVTKTFLKHVLLAGGLTILILILTSIMLNLYTSHGDSVSVPDFTGLTIKEAIKASIEKELKLEIIDSLFRSDRVKGVIIDQNPSPNFKVKKNRTIFLTITAQSREKIPMPNLFDVHVSQAKADMEVNELKLGKITYSPSKYKNLVLAQKYRGKIITPGTMVEKGSSIDLVLGSGDTDEDSETSVPTLLGQTLKIASDHASDSYLNIGKVTYDKSVKTFSDTARAVIWKQSPNPANERATLPMGQSIDVWLTVDKNRIRLLRRN
jgi:eukaryotic-like serine/threonine-protein kinase